jgi:hypothetical protein
MKKGRRRFLILSCHWVTPSQIQKLLAFGQKVTKNSAKLNTGTAVTGRDRDRLRVLAHLDQYQVGICFTLPDQKTPHRTAEVETAGKK